MNICLYFGSFNPIHIAHLMIAQQVLNSEFAEKVWFVLSPQNPFKIKASLLDKNKRLKLLQKAVKEIEYFYVSDIEFMLPYPSYTIETLNHLKKNLPEHVFSILMGSDTYKSLPQWKDFKSISQHHDIIVYKRKGFENIIPSQRTKILEFPMIDISASVIRKMIKEKKSIRFLVPEKIEEEIYKNYALHNF